MRKSNDQKIYQSQEDGYNKGRGRRISKASYRWFAQYEEEDDFLSGENQRLIIHDIDSKRSDRFSF